MEHPPFLWKITPGESLADGSFLTIVLAPSKAGT
jgi:hypothetical protein